MTDTTPDARLGTSQESMLYAKDRRVLIHVHLWHTKRGHLQSSFSMIAFTCRTLLLCDTQHSSSKHLKVSTAFTFFPSHFMSTSLPSSRSRTPSPSTFPTVLLPHMHPPFLPHIASLQILHNITSPMQTHMVPHTIDQARTRAARVCLSFGPSGRTHLCTSRSLSYFEIVGNIVVVEESVGHKIMNLMSYAFSMTRGCECMLSWQALQASCTHLTTLSSITPPCPSVLSKRRKYSIAQGLGSV